MIQTIQETIKQLHGSLREYIEATYHISAPALIDQRKELLDRAGVIHQIPYIESTPRYQNGERFAAIKGLPSPRLRLIQLFQRLGRSAGASSRPAVQAPN